MGVDWIKISTDIFNSKKIKQIETLPNGDTVIVIWFKLLTLAGTINDDGAIYFTEEIPYTEEMLAHYFNCDNVTLHVTLQLFERYGMIDIIDDVIYIKNWGEYQNVDQLEKIKQQTRNRVARYRERNKKGASEPSNGSEKEDENNVKNSNVTVTLPVTLRNATDKTRQDKTRIDKNRIDKTIQYGVVPSYGEVETYIKNHNFKTDPTEFYTACNSKNWTLNGEPIKNWRALLNGWEKKLQPSKTEEPVDPKFTELEDYWEEQRKGEL